jgi:hypothetical protein
MSLLSSSEIEDQIAMMFSGVMDQVMSILATEEMEHSHNCSSSTPQPKHHQRFVNRDLEAAHLRLWYDYFDVVCVYPRHTSAGGTICRELFS